MENLRKRLIVGRPAEVVHTPVSGVAAVQAELGRVNTTIREMGLKCRAELGIVVRSAEKEFAGRTFIITSSAQEAAKAIADIAALQDPQMVGTIYAVIDEHTGVFEFWTRPFIKGRDAEKILDLAVAKAMSDIKGQQ